jgi:hypothetical protein
MRQREPSYRGHSLSEWLQAPPSLEARTAIRAIGTNAIPTLLHWLSHNPPHWRTNLTFLDRKYLPTSISDFLDQPDHDIARQAFFMLGTNALPAVPALVKLMSQTDAPETAVRATYSLGYLGPQALPYLEDALSSTNPAQRAAILNSIGDMYYRRAGSADDCLPPLLKARFDADPFVRRTATNNINRIAPQIFQRYPQLY